MAKRRDVTRQLGALEETAAIEAREAREAQAEVESVAAGLERLRNERTDAYAAGDDGCAEALRVEIAEQTARLDEVSARAEGLARRANAARVEVAAFRTENAGELLAAREPIVREVTGKLNASVAETLQFHRQLLAERDVLDRHVADVPGASPPHDGPPTAHAWERALRELERAVKTTPELAPPLPTWSGLNHRRREDAVNLRNRLLRKRRTESEDDELRRLAGELE
jgi:hypothetical protein